MERPIAAEQTQDGDGMGKPSATDITCDMGGCDGQ